MNNRQYVDSKGFSTNGASIRYKEHNVINIGIPMKTLNKKMIERIYRFYDNDSNWMVY